MRIRGQEGRRRGGRGALLVASALVALVSPGSAFAQASLGLAGSWALEAPAGRGGRGNFAGFSTATRLTIRESASDVTVETNTGTESQMQTAVYKLDGSSNVVPGPIGWDTRATATRADGTLVVTVRRAIQGPDGELSFEIKDAYHVAGDVLTIVRSQGNRTLKLAYKRAPGGG